MSGKAKELGLEFKVMEGFESWAAFKPERATKDGIEYYRKIGSKVIYKYQEKDQSYTCLDCGSDILSARVAHPIHDGPFPMSGSGKCHYENVPYCPKCEEEPNFNGSFITVGKKY